MDLVFSSLVAMALSAGAAPVAGGASAATPSRPLGDNEIICRKWLEIGSLVNKKKQCFTKAQWDEISESQQRGVQRLRGDLSGGGTSN